MQMSIKKYSFPSIIDWSFLLNNVYILFKFDISILTGILSWSMMIKDIPFYILIHFPNEVIQNAFTILFQDISLKALVELLLPF